MVSEIKKMVANSMLKCDKNKENEKNETFKKN